MTFGLIILISFILLYIFGGFIALTPLFDVGYYKHFFSGMLIIIMIPIIVILFTHFNK